MGWMNEKNAKKSRDTSSLKYRLLISCWQFFLYFRSDESGRLTFLRAKTFGKIFGY